MYKVFLNQKLITISDKENITLKKTNREQAHSFSVSDIQKWFQNFSQNKESETTLIHNSPEHFFELFKSAFVKIDAAGGVVFDNNKKMLFIFRNGVWDLPKGKVDKGETTQQAAIREVEEECGITGLQIRKELPSTFHMYESPYPKTKGQWILKETFWYEMKYQGNAFGQPQQEEGITRVEWLPRTKLSDVFANTYANLKQIIEIYRL